jgi:hypothetical protein
MPDMEDMAHVPYLMSLVFFILKYLKDGVHIP